ncbi:MAG: response regulator transcription factor [Saprospiraceae bacterium]|nr:response regulator transcription factor [Saprospiraceae bacterium]
MEKIKAIIVDDEAPARANLELLLAKDTEIEILTACSDGISAIKAIELHQPDLIFLDIQMPEVSGFDVLKALPLAQRPYVIFVTAYDQYALKAFEVNAVDYLLKPFDDKRFFDAITKAKALIQQQDQQDLQAKLGALLKHLDQDQAQKYLKKLSVRQGSKISFIKVEDIVWIEADNQYVKVHLKTASHLMRQSLSYLDQHLDPASFYRIHRSAIVNVNRIESIEPYFKGDYHIRLDNGTVAKLSRHRTEGLKELLNW